MVQYLKRACFGILVLLPFIGIVRAEVFPVHATLVYLASSPTTPSLKVEAIDGKSYELALKPGLDAKDNVVVVDLVLRRVGSDQNLLEPTGRWHGLQAFNFGANDLANGPDRAIYGATRKFLIKREKYIIEGRRLQGSGTAGWRRCAI